MRRVSPFLVFTSAAVVLLGGCGRADAPPPPRPAPRPAPVEVRPLSSAAYVAEASSIDLLIIQASELAASRSSSSAIRDLAAMLARDHRGTSAQLSFAGRRLNLLPSATLSVGHRAVLDQLATTADFDSSYVTQMVRIHERGLQLHGDYLRRGDSPTLKPVAEMVAPVMRRHLDRLRGL